MYYKYLGVAQNLFLRKRVQFSTKCCFVANHFFNLFIFIVRKFTVEIRLKVETYEKKNTELSKFMFRALVEKKHIFFVFLDYNSGSQETFVELVRVVIVQWRGGG